MKYFVVIKQEGEGCDYTIGCGYNYLTIEANDDLEIYNQLKDIYSDEVSFEEIYYTELPNMKQINIEEMEKQQKCNLEGTKVYSNLVYTTNPPQYPWICSKCGEQGVDRGKTVDDSEFDKLIRKK